MRLSWCNENSSTPPSLATTTASISSRAAASANPPERNTGEIRTNPELRACLRVIMSEAPCRLEVDDVVMAVRGQERPREPRVDVLRLQDDATGRPDVETTDDVRRLAKQARSGVVVLEFGVRHRSQKVEAAARKAIDAPALRGGREALAAEERWARFVVPDLVDDELALQQKARILPL